MFFWFSVMVCVIALGAQVYLRSFSNQEKLKILFSKNLKYSFFFSLAVVFGYSFYLSSYQYKVWAGDAMAKFLLPPYQNINYFLYYAGFRFFVPSLLALIVAGLFFGTAKLLNKKFSERFFYPEEYWLGALGFFLAGYPGFIFYLIFLLSFFILFQLSVFIISKNKDNRISLYYFWMPLALISIFLSNIWFSGFELWNLLKI